MATPKRVDSAAKAPKTMTMSNNASIRKPTLLVMVGPATLHAASGLDHVLRRSRIRGGESDRWGARCRARLRCSDLDPDLLATGLPDRFRSVVARLSPAARARAWCGTESEPQHDTSGLSTFGRRRVRHESPRCRHPRRRAPAAEARGRGA